MWLSAELRDSVLRRFPALGLDLCRNSTRELRMWNHQRLLDERARRKAQALEARSVS